MDLVEELRKAALDCEDGERDPVTGKSTWPKEETIEWVCADEIEKLRNVLCMWVKFWEADGEDDPLLGEEAMEETREVLGL